MSNKFGIYIHFPYCSSICPYCNFNVYTSSSTNYNDFVELLLKDLKSRSKLFKGKILESIHFGGGSPSLLDINSISKILIEINRIFFIKPECEICIEINPYDNEVEDLQSYNQIGINRVSVGIQSFNDSKLKILGRSSTRESNLKFLDKIFKSNIDNYSFDFIFGVDDESVLDWEEEFSYLNNLNIKHISTYCLTIEESTPFWKMRERGRILDVTDEVFIEMTKITKSKLNKLGINQYEISNFSKPSYESKHNLLYWNNDSYLGIGPGAHSSFVDIDEEKYFRWHSPNSIRNYKDYVDGTNTFESGNYSTLTLKEYIKDSFLMGLRLKKGVCVNDMKSIRNFILDNMTIDMLLSEGLITFSSNNIKLTESGYNLSNQVIYNIIENIEFIDY